MPLFRYKALGAAGKSLTGVIDADSLIQAKERLRRDQLLITDLKMIKEAEEKVHLPPSLLLTFTRELSQLLRAGLPLYESLLTIEEKYKKHRAHPLFLDLCDRLKGGASLSSAFKRYPKTFDQIYLAMISSAEESGALPLVFEQLASLIAKQQKLRKQIFGAIAYPAFLAVFCFAITCGLFFFVIPSMQELFEGRRLHPLTQTIVAISTWLNAYWFPLCLILMAVFSLLYFWARTRLQALWMRVPLCKEIILHSALTRFARSTSLLLSSGVPFIHALELARPSMKNPPLESAIASAEKGIVEGRKLSRELQNTPLIPPLIHRMVGIAEETGKMAQAFGHIAEIYEEELERHTAQLNTFLQPALLLLLGAIVGVVILSILLPLTDVSSFLSN